MDSVARNRLRQREIAYLTNQLTLRLQRLHCERLRAKVQRCLLPLLLPISTCLAHQLYRPLIPRRVSLVTRPVAQFLAKPRREPLIFRFLPSDFER